MYNGKVGHLSSFNFPFISGELIMKRIFFTNILKN
jgi:hypothetical protein